MVARRLNLQHRRAADATFCSLNGEKNMTITEQNPLNGIMTPLSGLAEFWSVHMPMTGVSISNPTMVAAEFDRRADDFAALAEAAATREDCLRYRELEQQYRLRAEEERAREIWKLYSANDDGRVVAA